MMSKYFRNVENLDELKTEYRKLLKANHPDAGGDAEVMKEINVEYDALFPIYKARVEKETHTVVKETAETTRREFYTQGGWAGSNYDWHLTTTEIAKIIRAYVKEKYPTWKWSVTSEYFSGGSSLSVALMEAPVDIFNKEYFAMEQDPDGPRGQNSGYRHDYLGDVYAKMEEGKLEIDLSENHMELYRDMLNDIGYETLKDVIAFVNSYRMDDSDGMIDYFDCNFYWDISIGKYSKGFKIVPKTPRIKNKEGRPARKNSDSGKNADADAKPAIGTEKEGGKPASYTYRMTRGEDTRDGTDIWIIRIAERLSREDYIAESKKMKKRGGYYSRFVRGFPFRFNPSEKFAQENLRLVS